MPLIKRHLVLVRIVVKWLNSLFPNMVLEQVILSSNPVFNHNFVPLIKRHVVHIWEASIGKKILLLINFSLDFKPFQASQASTQCFLWLDKCITTISSTLESYIDNEVTTIQLKWLVTTIFSTLYPFCSVRKRKKGGGGG